MHEGHCLLIGPFSYTGSFAPPSDTAWPFLPPRSRGAPLQIAIVSMAT